MRFSNFAAGIVYGVTLTALAPSAFGQSSLASLSGTVKTDGCAEPAPAASAMRVVLVEGSTGREIQETRPAADGSFRLREVPFSRYRVEARLGGTGVAAREVSVTDALPMSVELSCSVELPERSASTRRQAPMETSAHTFFASRDILALPVASREKSSEAVLLQSADVVPDEDGRMHVRGEDAQIQYVVDGIPWSGNPTRVYAPLFSADIAKSIDVRGGGLPAQYAAGSAVVAVTTRDGLEQPFTARAGAGTATYNMREAQLAGMGRLGPNAGLFLSASQSGSERYLDPISGFEPIHAGGGGRHFFGKLSMLPTENAELRFVGAFDQSGYEVPNYMTRSPGQDQGADLQSYLAGARLDLDPDADWHVSAAAYSRRIEATVKSGGLSRVGSPADSQKAVAQNERFFLGTERENGYHGGQLELTLRPGGAEARHTFRAGLSGEANPLREKLAFAVTNAAFTAEQSDNRLLPYDITQGGRPLEASDERMGWAASAYVQDEFIAGKWSFLPGLRYDAFTLFETEHALSPRLAAAYAWNPNLDLRVSVDYLMARAPLENILMSSDPALRPLAGGDQGNTPSRVGAERALALDIGADWRPLPFLSVGGSAYAKYLQNFLVKAELGASGLIFPINLKEGLIGGGTITARMQEWKRFSGSLSIGSCISVGLKPEDGSSPIEAGLLVGEEGHNYGHPFAGEEFFPTEHNQIATAVMNTRYRVGGGLSATLAGRFDSGLPFDLVGADGKGLDEAESRAELKKRGYSDDVIDLLSLAPEEEEPDSPDKSVAPHAIFDLGAEWKRPIGAANFEVRAAILNVLDTPYLQKFESSFGSTHFGPGRTLGMWVAVEY